MCITEFIKQLQEAQETYGDLELTEDTPITMVKFIPQTKEETIARYPYQEVDHLHMIIS